MVDIRTKKWSPAPGFMLLQNERWWERDIFYNEVYSIETLLHITCQIISKLKHHCHCFPKFVSIWPAPEVVDGIYEVCPSTTKLCPLVNKLVALGRTWFFTWWQIFDINKQFCPLVRLGPFFSHATRYASPSCSADNSHGLNPGDFRPNLSVSRLEYCMKSPG